MAPPPKTTSTKIAVDWPVVGSLVFQWALGIGEYVFTVLASGFVGGYFGGFLGGILDVLLNWLADESTESG